MKWDYYFDLHARLGSSRVGKGCFVGVEEQEITFESNHSHWSSYGEPEWTRNPNYWRVQLLFPKKSVPSELLMWIVQVSLRLAPAAVFADWLEENEKPLLKRMKWESREYWPKLLDFLRRL